MSSQFWAWIKKEKRTHTKEEIITSEWPWPGRLIVHLNQSITLACSKTQPDTETMRKRCVNSSSSQEKCNHQRGETAVSPLSSLLFDMVYTIFLTVFDLQLFLRRYKSWSDNITGYLPRALLPSISLDIHRFLERGLMTILSKARSSSVSSGLASNIVNRRLTALQIRDIALGFCSVHRDISNRQQVFLPSSAGKQTGSPSAQTAQRLFLRWLLT